MRSSLVLVLAACNITNLHEPIGVVAKDLTPEFAANLEEAAACWALRLGVPFVTGDAASQVDQQVTVQFDDSTCLVAAAQTQGGWPESIDICPEKYWPQLGGPYTGQHITPFRVLSHELGHVANIVGHPDDPAAVMRGGGTDFTPMFHQVDIDMFTRFNAGFVQSSPCNEVVRSYRSGTALTISHCACDTGPLDPDQPIAIIPEPEIETPFIAELAIAAQCWNMHYGVQLVFRDPQPGDQVAHVESCLEPGRAVEDGSVEVCAAVDQGLVGDAMNAIGQVVGVEYTDYTHPRGIPFVAADDIAFSNAYTAPSTGCANVVSDPVTGVCTCN